MGKERRLIQSIKRASDILGLFIVEQKPLGITEFAKRLGLAKTTIASIVQTLEAIGYLEKDPASLRYRLGPQIFQLGMKCASSMDVITTGRAWIERLCFQFREPVNVGTLVGDKATIVMRIEPENHFMVFPQAGPMIPLHSTSIGKLLCAYMEESKRTAILSGYAFEKFTDNTLASKPAFMKELDKIRSSGISFDNQEMILGMAGIGGPVFNHAGALVAAFAVTGNADNIMRQREDIIAAVRFTTHQLSSRLGYSG
ncbi:MAG: IclR family transcriptional regulator [Syntrophaceae bacterium]